jgi:hypothetical protein
MGYYAGMGKEVVAALQTALEDLGDTEVRYGGNRMSISDVLRNLVVDRLHTQARADAEAYFRERKVLAEYEETDRFDLGIRSLCELARWVTEPSEEELFGEDDS